VVLFTFFTGEVSQQSDGLDGLAQTHLVGQNAVQLFLVHCDQPVESDVLVFSQRAVKQERYGGLDLLLAGEKREIMVQNYIRDPKINQSLKLCSQIRF